MNVLVLGGGPGAEREISLQSAAAVSAALREAGLDVHSFEIEAPSIGEIRAMPGEVVFPVLHGAFGEGGALQDLLEQDGRPYVGCRPAAARLAMDKLATKLAAARAGLETPPASALNIDDAACPVALPVAVKPVHEGSSVGLMICRRAEDWDRAHARVRSGEFGRRVFMVERMIPGRELTVGLLAGESGQLGALPIVEVISSRGVYDYEAKYTRGDTRYVVDPELPAGLADALHTNALALAAAIGVRHLSRVDFMQDDAGRAWLLEVNTMPGFTPASLLPKAAAATGLDLPGLASRLVRLAKDVREV